MNVFPSLFSSLLFAWLVLAGAPFGWFTADAMASTAPRQMLGSQTEWWVDAEETLDSLDRLREVEDELPWQRSTEESLAFGFTAKPYWYRIKFEPLAQAGSDVYLHIAEPLLNRIDLYVLHGDQLIESHRLGNDFPFQDRLFEHKDFVVPLSLRGMEPITIYARVQTNGSMYFEPILWQPQAFAEHERSQAILSGVYYGIMLVMLIYNLFLYFTVRDPAYLYYVGCVGVYTLFMASFYGDAYQYLWPNAVAWNETAVALTVALSGLMSLLFSSTFLRLRRLWPGMYRYFLVLIAVTLLLVGLTFVIDYSLSIRLNSLHSVVSMISMLVVGFWMWAKGHTHARYFALGWFVVVMGTSALVLSRWGFLPSAPLIANGARLGAVMEVTLLSFALGDRINQERAARALAQQQLLESTRREQQAQQALLEAKESANFELEVRVSARTQELESALQELSQVNRFLEEISHTDQLTGLHNRHYFVERYHEEYQRARRQQSAISVIMLDIDRFKSFNDTYGHLAGDECLKAVASSLARCVNRAGDTLARYGGEEFILVLSGTELKGAATLAERLRLAVAELELEFDGRAVPVTISAGVASTHPQNLDAIERLIQQADDALYAAKASGRNCVCRYPEDLMVLSDSRS